MNLRHEGKGLSLHCIVNSCTSHLQKEMVLTIHYRVKKVLDHQTSLKPEPIWPTCQGNTQWRHDLCTFSPEVYIRFEEWCPRCDRLAQEDSFQYTSQND